MYRIPPEKIFSSFFFFFLSFYLYLFIYSTVSLFTLYYPLFVSLVRLDSSSFTLFIFIFIRFYFRSFLRAPPLFPRIFVIPYPLVCIFVARPRPLPLKKIREKKKCIFIYCTNRSNVREIESISREIPLASFVQRAPPPRISTKEQLGFPFHIFNFFTLFSIPLSTPSNSVAPHVERDARTLIPRIHNNALVAISYNYGRRR